MSNKVVGFLVIAGFIGGLAWVFVPRDAPSPVDEDVATDVHVDGASPEGAAIIDFPPFVLPVDELNAIWAAERESAVAADDEARALIDAMRRVDFATALMSRGLFEGDLEALRTAYDDERRRWAHVRTGEEFLSLGWTAHQSFEAALREILRLASTTDTQLDDLLKNPLEPTVHAYYESCGAFLDHALRFNFVGPTGEVLIQPEFFTLLFRRMWVMRMRDQWMPETVLPGLELREFLRWQLEHAEVALPARLNLIEEFELEHGFTDYPASYARAVAHVLADDPDTARAILESAVAEGESHPLVVDGIARLEAVEGSGESE